jgi:hypothetical protein
MPDRLIYLGLQVRSDRSPADRAQALADGDDDDDERPAERLSDDH